MDAIRLALDKDGEMTIARFYVLFRRCVKKWYYLNGADIKGDDNLEDHDLDIYREYAIKIGVDLSHVMALANGKTRDIHPLILKHFDISVNVSIDNCPTCNTSIEDVRVVPFPYNPEYKELDGGQA